MINILGAFRFIHFQYRSRRDDAPPAVLSLILNTVYPAIQSIRRPQCKRRSFMISSRGELMSWYFTKKVCRLQLLYDTDSNRCIGDGEVRKAKSRSIHGNPGARQCETRCISRFFAPGVLVVVY